MCLIKLVLEEEDRSIDGEQLGQSTNTADDARLDIKAGGFWSANRHECAYLDVRVFFTPTRAHTATAPWNNGTEPKNRTNVVTTKTVSRR